jgi:serine/threonine-protein kinase
MPDEWKQISDLYHAALKLPENERAAFLQKRIASDGVRREVASLLANERTGEHLLDSPALDVAARMMTDNAPSLTTGQTLGHYQIKSRLGKGGMGEVYRAHDSKLGRDVAIKTLPPEFARDPDRVARFNREAKLLASLNHPNIAAIYGLEESGGTNYLVLELVEGETLADHIAGSAGVLAGKEAAGTAALPEILKLALQIAEALEAAHEKGVIHRDLKPANIKVTPEGKVKVLDFGLAKAFAGEQAEVNLTNSPTLSDMATMKGVILGTAAYMSPEQAKGKPVDKRTDVWAFGCVLYEMLTGQAAFQGEDVSDIFAAVIRSEPDWTKLPANLHWRIKELLGRCLEKEVRNRYGSISDARVDIQKSLGAPSGVMVQQTATSESHTKPWKIYAWIAAVAILGIIAGGMAVWKLTPAEPRSVTRFEYALPGNEQLFNSEWLVLAVSPDGRQFVYRTSTALNLRSIDKWDVKSISSASDGPLCPFFSPDGQWIGYWSFVESKLKKVSINGGAPIPLCDTGMVVGASWSSDGTILFSEQQRGILKVSADGGTPETLIMPKNKEGLYHPRLLPDGKSVLFTVGPSPYKIAIQSLESHERNVLFDGDCAWYVPTGHLVYASGKDLFAVPFDLGRLRVAGERVALGESVHRRSSTQTPQFSLSSSGTLVYMPPKGNGVNLRNLVWVDREGKEEPLAAPVKAYSNPQISPDGKRIALAIDAGENTNIGIWDIDRGGLGMLTTDSFPNQRPLWAANSKWIVFASNRIGYYGIYRKRSDGAGEVEQIGLVPGQWNGFPASWSGDGTRIILWYITSSFDIGELPIGSDRTFKPLLTTKANEIFPQISPDGRWMAYASDESGKFEVYVRSFPDVERGERIPISTNGGTCPLWSRDGRELFYHNEDAVMAVSMETKPTFRPGIPKRLFAAKDYAALQWDVSSDGKRFLMTKEVRPSASSGQGFRKINVILNWFEELKQRVPNR